MESCPEDLAYLDKNNKPQEYTFFFFFQIQEKDVLMACKLLCQRPIKKKQLFIYGPPSKQQTSIFHFLQKYSGYTMPAPERTTALGHIIIRISGSLTNSTKQADRAGLSHSQKKERHTPNTLLKALYGQECRLDSKYSIVFTTKANVPIDSQSSTQKSK